MNNLDINVDVDIVTNIITERVVRADRPDCLRDPIRFEASLLQQAIVKVPAEPDYFREWLDSESKGVNS